MRKETKLQKTKIALIRVIKQCMIDYVTDFDDQIDSLEYCQTIMKEIDVATEWVEKVSNAKRTRELDTLVRQYFGEDTAEDLLIKMKDEYEDDPNFMGRIGCFVFINSEGEK